MSIRTGLYFALVVLATHLPTAVFARDQVSWAIANRTDDKIEALVSRLEPYLEPLPGRAEAAGAVLYHQILIAVDATESRRCENLILTVQDPAGMPDELLQPWQPDTDEVVSMSAFVRRGGVYRRLGDDEIVHVQGLATLGRSHFRMSWGDLAEGDVVGWSMVTRQDAAHDFVPIRLAERIPIVLAALQVQSNGDYAYELRSNAISPEAIKQKREEVVDGRAMSLKASVNQRPAVDAVPDEWPWANDYPHMALYLDEVKLYPLHPRSPPSWETILGWNRAVFDLATIMLVLRENFDSLDITLPAIMTGENTPAEKTEAAFIWVRDHTTLLESLYIGLGGGRKFEEIVKSRKARGFWKTLLLGAILERYEIEAAIACVRAPELGGIDHGWPSLNQFSDLAMRTVEDGVIRYWAPQCGDCEPGTVPASWHGAEVLTYDSAAIEKAESYYELRLGFPTSLDSGGKQPLAVFEKIGD